MYPKGKLQPAPSRLAHGIVDDEITAEPLRPVLHDFLPLETQIMDIQQELNIRKKIVRTESLNPRVTSAQGRFDP